MSDVKTRGGARAGTVYLMRRPSQQAMRTCLGPICKGRKTFLSEGPHNRLCERCRARANELDGHGPDAGEGLE